MSSLDDPNLRNDPRLKYMPPYFGVRWDPKKDFRNRAKTAEDFELARMTYKKQVELVGMMHDAGVQFLAGTDVFNPYCFPGFSLHDELSLMVKAGLTPMEALQAATHNPAVYLGMADSMGTIEQGKVADLVLLDANPLDDISNTTRIAAVMIGGSFFGRQPLDSILAKAQHIANIKPIADLMFKLVEEQSLEAAMEKYRELRSKEYENYDFSESQLNSLGYRLLQLKRVKDAIEVFRLNAEIYPHSSDVYDSLGEAYMLNGDKELAIKNYRRSVELDPKNKNGIEKLRSLEKQ
jgi:tetratricopeptide (TPR) repeat protein